MRLLGRTSHCRQWIPNYAEIETEWTAEGSYAFECLKEALQTATLGLHDPDESIYPDRRRENRLYEISSLTRTWGAGVTKTSVLLLASCRH